MTDVPPAVRSKALAVGAEQWLNDLPDLIADLERDWSIRVGRPYSDPTEAFVAEATLEDGTPAVLKLVIPRDGNHAAYEAAVLRMTGGDGCVRMLREDVSRGALLLERLGRSLAELGLSLAERLEILCATASRVWRQAPNRGLRTGSPSDRGLPSGAATDRGLPSGADKAAGLAGYMPRAWDELGRPCSERAVEYALACAAERGDAHDDERARSPAQRSAAMRTMTSGPSWSMVTSISGTRWRRPAATSLSTPMGCWPRPSVTWAS